MLTPWGGRGGPLTHRGGLHTASRLRAGPARPVHQQSTALLLQARQHVTPLPGPYDAGWGEKEGQMAS